MRQAVVHVGDEVYERMLTAAVRADYSVEEWIVELIEKALRAPCPYCGREG